VASQPDHLQFSLDDVEKLAPGWCGVTFSAGSRWKCARKPFNFRSLAQKSKASKCHGTSADFALDGNTLRARRRETATTWRFRGSVKT
jgi:hypothetical protein